MGCPQSLATGANGTVANARNKKLDIGSNLVITRQTNFREDYNVVKRVGEGSISNIYKVRTKSASGANVEKDKLYALKEIDTSLMVKPEFLEDMRNEIALLRNITHPNILKIY